MIFISNLFPNIVFNKKHLLSICCLLYYQQDYNKYLKILFLSSFGINVDL